MGKLAGKTALITGGSSGIGLATALLFHAEGAQVAISGRDPRSLDRARATLGEDVIALPSDAGDTRDIAALMASVRQALGRLDILLINAGSMIATPFESVSESQFDTQANVNFKGVFFTIQQALPLLPANSSIIVITSIANQLGSPHVCVYAACKAALRSLVRSLGLELIGRGIRVNAISPGPISTAIFDRAGLSAADVQTIKTGIRQKSPIKRFGDPTEVARVALFLASDDASYLVGEEIVVDGGMSLL